MNKTFFKTQTNSNKSQKILRILEQNAGEKMREKLKKRKNKTLKNEQNSVKLKKITKNSEKFILDQKI